MPTHEHKWILIPRPIVIPEMEICEICARRREEVEREAKTPEQRESEAANKYGSEW